jgi:hypothetical protein
MFASFTRALLRVGVMTSFAWQTCAAQWAAEPVRVLVSRRQVRVVFPRHTARTWGWPAQKDEGNYSSYVWGIIVGGMDGPRILWVRLDSRTNEARRFPSLERLIAAARAQRCLPGMVAQCTDSSMRASVEHGRVVFTLRDSAQIARLFGMRPVFVRAWQQSPGDQDRYSSDSVRVQYIAPDIPPPTAATRQDAARSQRRYEASISTVLRFLDGGDPFRPLWLVIGDSEAVSVGEMYCRYDSCSSGGYAAVHDSGWTILDSAIARLQPVQRDSTGNIEILIRGNERKYVKALRPGRTVLRVRGLHGPSDTAASSTPPARQIEREIIVAPPIDRVEIVPRPDSVHVLETFTLGVRVLDRDGREVNGLPWQLEVLDGEDRGIRIGPEPQSIMFSAPGRRRISARLGPHSDTLSVMVVVPNVK